MEYGRNRFATIAHHIGKSKRDMNKEKKIGAKVAHLWS